MCVVISHRMKMATDESKQEIDADVVPTTDGQPSNIGHMTGAVAAAEHKLVPNSNVIPEKFSPTMRQVCIESFDINVR